MMSTMQIFPTQQQLSMSDWAVWWWSQVQMLMWVSSEDLSAARAWRTVAEIASDFNGGLPRQRSATSCANKRAAIHRIQRFFAAAK